MSSEKREFKSFINFGGNIKNGIYEYPVLYYKDSKNHIRLWQVLVRLIKKQESYPKYGINWDLNKDEQVNIIIEYIENNTIPKNVVAQVWSISGVKDMNITKHSPTIINKGMNIGKLNERNILQQALIRSRSKYLEKKNSGSIEDLEQLNSKTDSDSKLNNVSKKSKTSQLNTKTKNSILTFPMLAHKYQEKKDNIDYPALIQPKLDGVRCITYLNKNGEVIMYSRNLKQHIGFDYIKEELKKPLEEYKDFKGLYLDGELYKHGLNLQKISGIVRNPKKNNNIKSSDGIKYYIFDCFYLDELNMPYTERLDLLNKLFNNSDYNIKYSVNVETLNIEDEKQIDKVYKDYLSEGYEGAMIKNKNSPYLTGTKKSQSLRSKEVLKLKMTYTDEFEIIGFTQGERGKDKNALIWKLQTKNGNEFTAQPKNMTYKKREELFEKFTNNPDIFEEKYKNKMMTVEYQDLSKLGIPMRHKAIVIRDYE